MNVGFKTLSEATNVKVINFGELFNDFNKQKFYLFEEDDYHLNK